MKKSNYSSLEEVEINAKLDHPGIFNMPEGKIKQLYGEKKFITIYFDNEEDYNRAIKILCDVKSQTKEHPMIDTEKFLSLLESIEDKI
jgi:hypothetical protein